MLIKGQNTNNIKFGNSFTQDGLKNEKFDYMLSNPPFGVEWKKVESEIKKEHEKQGFTGRFGAGLPRISDGSFLFLQHMISKMRPENGGARLGIVFNGSPLFSGGAGSGESEIRKWIIENDMLEAIIALPNQLFYNTGISTYIWIVTNRKEKERKGKIQLINAVEFFQKMSRSLGNKRNEIDDNHIDEITKIYGEFKKGEYCKVFDNNYFGYTRVTIERPLRLNFQTTKERIARLDNQTAFKNLAKSKKKGDKGIKEIKEGKKYQQLIKDVLVSMNSSKLYKNREVFIKDLKVVFAEKDDKVKASTIKMIVKALSERDETADICLDSKGSPEADTELRDYENVPLQDDIEEYFKREVSPHVTDAWMDRSKDKVGYEINFTKEFYKYKPLRSLDEIRNDILALEKETEGLMNKILKL
jgi:type I restriction enzyme M protein